MREEKFRWGRKKIESEIRIKWKERGIRKEKKERKVENG